MMFREQMHNGQMNISNGLSAVPTDAQPKSNTHTFSIKQMMRKKRRTHRSNAWDNILIKNVQHVAYY